MLRLLTLTGTKNRILLIQLSHINSTQQILLVAPPPHSTSTSRQRFKLPFLTETVDIWVHCPMLPVAARPLWMWDNLPVLAVQLMTLLLDTKTGGSAVGEIILAGRVNTIPSQSLKWITKICRSPILILHPLISSLALLEKVPVTSKLP